MADLNNIMEEIKGMSVMELNELVKMLENEFGVEQTEFTLLLKEIGGNKIAVIKAVREITGLGLSEAKAVVDGAPSTVKEGLSKDAANEALEKLKAAGAVAELK